METFPRFWTLQRPKTRSFDISLIWAWTYGLANNREASDLTRHGAHYEVSAIMLMVRQLRRKDVSRRGLCVSDIVTVYTYWLI